MRFVDYNIENMIEAVKGGKKLICFGAGQMLDSFCQIFHEYNVSQYIEFIIDNNEKKWNTVHSIDGHHIMIYPPEALLKDLGKESIILITSRFFKEIYAQMQELDLQIEHIIVFSGFMFDNYSDLKLRKGFMDCEIVCETDMHIPKIVHYCWFGKAPIPDRYKVWMQSWKKYCPDYEIVEWNEDNYDVWKNQYMAEAYDAKKWGFVPDYARLDILYQHGGIYLDTDVELVRNLDPLLHQQAFCGFQDERRVAFGLGFGSVPQNEVILHLRNDYDKRHFRNSDGSYNLTASPKYQTEALMNQGMQANGQFQKLPHIVIYPKIFFSPMHHFSRKIVRNHQTFSIHHFDGSWVDSKEHEQQDWYVACYKRIPILS